MTKNHYIDNQKLTSAVDEWAISCRAAKKANEQEPAMTNYIGKSIMDIANGVLRKPNWNRYTYHDEMRGDAIEACLKYLKNFDSTVKTRSGNPNAYGYISMICDHAYKSRILREEYQEYYKMKALVDSLDGEYAELYSSDDFDVSNSASSDIIADYKIKIAEFELKCQKRKDAARDKAREKSSANVRFKFNDLFDVVDEEIGEVEFDDELFEEEDQ